MKLWKKTETTCPGFVELERNKESIFIRAAHISIVTQKNLKEVRVELISGQTHCVTGDVRPVMKLISEAG